MTDITKGITFSVIDELGIDPLRDKSYEAIANIKEYRYYTISPEERHNMPLVSYNVYLNEEYWRVLMVYNGIADMFAVKEGMRIKVPALGLVSSALTYLLAEQSNKIDTVRI